MKKLRKDSKFGLLSDALRDELAELMLSGKAGLDDIQAWLAKHGVVVSQQSISEYYRNHVLPTKWRHMNRVATELNKVDDAPASDAAHRAVAQKVFELSTDPHADPKLLSEFYKLMLAGQRQAVDERKLALLEAKAKAADEAQATLKQDDLSPEEREQKIREIFGLV